MKKIIKTIFSTMLALALIFAFTGCGGYNRKKIIEKGLVALKEIDNPTVTVDDVVGVFEQYELASNEIWFEKNYDSMNSAENGGRIKRENIRVALNNCSLFSQNGSLELNKSTANYNQFARAIIEKYGLAGYRCVSYCAPWGKTWDSVAKVAIKIDGYYVSAGAWFIEQTASAPELAKKILYDYLDDPDSLIVDSAKISCSRYSSSAEEIEEDKAMLAIIYRAKNLFGGYDRWSAAFKVAIEGIVDKSLDTRKYVFNKLYIRFYLD